MVAQRDTIELTEFNCAILLCTDEAANCGKLAKEGARRPDAAQVGRNRLLAIMPCTPWRMSTTWVTAKSAATEISE